MIADTAGVPRGDALRTGSSAGRKLLIWTVMPTHHQADFFQALRTAGFDVVVFYFGEVTADRVELGWKNFAELPSGERRVAPSLRSLALCHDWRQRVHVVPGYSRPFLMQLSMLLSALGISWLHWSEASRSGALRLRHVGLVRLAYGALVNRWALGALAIGDLATRDFQRWGISPARIRYLPYSIAALKPAPSATRATCTATHEPRFLFIGALCERKGIDVLLQAFAQLRKDYPQSELDLVGADQADGQYQRLAARLGLGTAVRFLAPRPADEIGAVLADCSVLVLPSRFDGWGVVINEATSLGKPVIATDMCGAAHHLVVDGSNGYVVPANDPATLADRMSRYCRDRSLVDAHGCASLRLFQDVSPPRNALRFSEALEQLQLVKFHSSVC